LCEIIVLMIRTFVDWWVDEKEEKIGDDKLSNVREVNNYSLVWGVSTGRVEFHGLSASTREWLGTWRKGRQWIHWSLINARLVMKVEGWRLRKKDCDIALWWMRKSDWRERLMCRVSKLNEWMSECKRRNEKRSGGRRRNGLINLKICASQST